MKGGRTGRSFRSKQGFTLLEMLLAVALGAYLVTMMTAFLFSMAGLWGAGSNERLFEKHARGVSRFLEHSFQTASSRYSTSDDSNAPVYWMNWEGDESAKDFFLTFELEKSPGALIWPEDPMPHVVCSLFFDPDEGLFLLWRSRLEEDFDEDPPRKTMISPFVRQVEYHYINYEEENPQWEIETTPLQEADGTYVSPERIELVFEFKGEEVKRQLILPKTMSGTPIL